MLSKMDHDFDHQLIWEGKVNPARLTWPCGLMLASLLVLGCGLSNYEQQMLLSQTYVENKDHEEQVLGMPLAPPPKLSDEGKKTGPVVDFYIRAPRGINGQYDPNPISEVMWRYPPQSGPGQAGCPFLAMYLAVSTTMDRDQFWEEVQRPFMPVDLSLIKPVTKTPIEGPTLDYEYDSRTVEERTGPKSFFMYVYRASLPEGKVARIAVIFCAPENVGTSPAVQEAMDMCLKTLSIGGKPASGGWRHRS